MNGEPALDADPQMLAPLLTIGLRGDDRSRVRRMIVSGEVDMSSAPALLDAVVDLLSRSRPHRIEIDLRGVSFLDCAGVRTLLMCESAAGNAGCSLTLTSPHPRVSRVLHTVGLLEHFGMTAPPASVRRDARAG
jgi:anti-anti-sigma factor